MANLFRSVPIRKPKSNYFDLSHEVDTTCNMGSNIPILCEPVVPGDKWRLQTEILVRLAPTLAPIMHRVNVYTHFFFVPNRLIWDDWEKFITRGASGELTPEYPVIRLDNTDVKKLHSSTLFDYLDFQSVSRNDKIAYGFADALPFRAYQLIYDEYYRDQNLEEAICANVRKQESNSIGGVPFGSGVSTNPEHNNALLTLRSRAWEKDYFTSALASPQRGADVRLPLSGTADVVLKDGVLDDPEARVYVKGYGVLNDARRNISNDEGVLSQDVSNEGGTSTPNPVVVDPNGTLKADLSNATSATINELRRSMRLQEFLEKTARGGSRYIEQILSHFGVRSSDARLQRPEYLGGGISPIIISEVIQQSQSTADSPQGNMSGHGVSAQVTHQFKRFFEEHGYVIGILSVMPKPGYMQGTPRKYLKRDFFDFYWPEFANLGEQAIINEELYADYGKFVGHGVDYAGNGKNSNDEVFGYTPRYAEYKYIPSRVHGDFRGNLNYWHMARDFTKLPTLSKEFVMESPTTRIWPATYQYLDHLWIQCYHNIKAKRPMPKFGVPTL